MATQPSAYIENIPFTKSFPSHEVYSLTSQIRRSAASVPTNIAEGCGRDSNTEMKRFLIIASGSISELEYQVLLSKELEYFSIEQYTELTNEIIELRKMLYAFIKKL